jgi:hypothetical protein
MAAMTDEQRGDFFDALQMVDAMDIADFVREHHPAIFDAAADRIRNTRAVLTAASRSPEQTGENT